MDIHDNLFPCTPQFLSAYLRLAYKYSFHWPRKQVPSNFKFHYYASDLARDLLKETISSETALVSFGSDDITPRFEISCSEAGENILHQLVSQSELLSKIGLLVKGVHYGGGTIVLDIASESAKHEEIEVLPLPRLAYSRLADSRWYFFLLLDAAVLQPSSANAVQKKIELLLLTSLVASWFAEVTSPKLEFASGIGDVQLRAELRDDEFNSVSEWFSCATLPEFAELGVSCAGLIRMNKAPFVFSFDDEGTPCEKDFWENRWNPRLPLAGLKQEELLVLRRTARALIPLCPWIDCNDMLVDLTATKEVAGSDPHLSKKCHGNWISTKRQQKETIKKQLREVRSIDPRTSERETALLRNPFLVVPQNYLSLDHKLLLGLSLIHWLDPEGSLLQSVESDVLTDCELGETMDGIARIAFYLYAQQPLDASVIHGIMQRLDRYCHEDLKVPHRIDLRAHLLHAARGEPALHALRQFYRDHFFHVLEVASLGHLLLDTKVTEGQFLWEIVSEKLPGSPSRQEVLKLWYTAAVLHDIGYAVNVLNGSRDHLKFFQHSDALRSLSERITNWFQDETELPEIKALGVGNTPDLRKDHGVVAAMHLRSLLEEIGDSDPAVKSKDFEPAIQAIALHNLRQPSDRISFGKQPLAFLLALCDQLQEWRRPRLPYSFAPHLILAGIGGNSALSRNIFGAFKSIDVNISISGTPESGHSFELIKSEGDKPCIEFIIQYNESINRNSNVFHIWLDSTLNFQRLSFDDLPFDISVQYVTPLFRYSNGSTRQSQLHRLRDAARETHMTFLARWFPNRPESKPESDLPVLTNDCLTHWIDHNSGYECLKLYLHELAGKNLMTRDIGAFWNRLREWRRFNEDRDFPGDYGSVPPK